MSTARTKLQHLVDAAIRQNQQSARLTFRFGNEEIGYEDVEVVSTIRRNTAEAFDDSADFAAALMPFISRLIATFAAAEDYEFSLGEEEVAAFIQDMNLAGLVDELKRMLPRLMIFIVKGSVELPEDPDEALDYVRLRMGPIWNPEIYKALFYQMQVEGLTFQVRALMSKFTEEGGHVPTGAAKS